MIGFRVVNLLVPNDPTKFKIKTPTGAWEFEQDAQFQPHKKALQDGKCAETYIMFHPVTMTAGTADCDAAFDEVGDYGLNLKIV